jgi:hypothetical protein
MKLVWPKQLVYPSSHSINVSLPSPESEESCIYVLRVYILSLSTIFQLDSRTVPTVTYFFFHFIPPINYQEDYYIGNIRLSNKWMIKWKAKYTTTSEQCQNIPQRQSNVKIYHNVRAMSKYTTTSEQCQDIPQYQSNVKIYHNVRAMSRYTTMSEQCQDIPQCQSNVKIYHNVRAMSRYTTTSEQCQNIPQRQNNVKIYHNVRATSRYTTTSEQCQDIPQCQSNVKT